MELLMNFFENRTAFFAVILVVFLLAVYYVYFRKTPNPSQQKVDELVRQNTRQRQVHFQDELENGQSVDDSFEELESEDEYFV